MGTNQAAVEKMQRLIDEFEWPVDWLVEAKMGLDYCVWVWIDTVDTEDHYDLYPSVIMEVDDDWLQTWLKALVKMLTR